ncbi:2328_t:CDS:2 [Funneliformis geosporum]|nr:2328_t:CDS:2 [Funneliformis geosporum]
MEKDIGISITAFTVLIVGLWIKFRFHNFFDGHIERKGFLSWRLPSKEKGSQSGDLNNNRKEILINLSN